MRNLVRDRARRRSARPPEALAPAEALAALDAVIPDDLGDTVAATEGLALLLAELPESQHRAVFSVYVADHSVTDTAARLGIPPGTVNPDATSPNRCCVTVGQGPVTPVLPRALTGCG